MIDLDRYSVSGMTLILGINRFLARLLVSLKSEKIPVIAEGLVSKLGLWINFKVSAFIRWFILGHFSLFNTLFFFYKNKVYKNAEPQLW